MPRFTPRAPFNLGLPINGTRKVVASTTLSSTVASGLQGVGNLTIEEAVRSISYQQLNPSDANQSGVIYNDEQEEAYHNEEIGVLTQLTRVPSRRG
jgi:hypothetical protein